MSEKTRKKIGKANRGNIAWNRGLTKETDKRVKMYSDKNMGHKYTMESRIQMSKSAEKRANTKKYKEWFKKHNPSFNEEIMKRKSENVKLLGIYKGENNPRYIDNLNIKEIIDLYINKKMIINDIAKKFGVGRGTIRRRLQKENIKVFRGQRV